MAKQQALPGPLLGRLLGRLLALRQGLLQMSVYFGCRSYSISCCYLFEFIAGRFGQ